MNKHNHQKRQSTNLLRFRSLAMLVVAGVAASFAWLSGFAGTGAHAAGAEDVESIRATLEKWVDTRRVISQEQRDWATGREMLNERIALVKREIESARGRVKEAQATITEADTKRAELVEENEKLKLQSVELAKTVIALEQRTKELIRKLPDPIKDRVKPLSQRLPEDSAGSKLSLSVRFQNVVGILNEVNKFNREISVTSEVRALPDGTSAEVTALYVGISQGYYVSGNGKIAGIGQATDEGWVWKPANEAAPQIARAIAILKNESVAAFVMLPVEIK